MLLIVSKTLDGSIALRWWYLLLLMALGVGSIAAGLWLWHGDPRGIRWSRPLLALQVLHVHTATWGAGLFLGMHVLLTVGENEWVTIAGTTSRLDLLVGVGMPWKVSVNLFALAALVSLLRSPDAYLAPSVDPVPSADADPAAEPGSPPRPDAHPHPAA